MLGTDPRPSPAVVRALLDGQKVSDPLVQVFQLALSGFGYNFFDARNVARANDQVVRARVAELLGEGAAALGTLESAYREAHVPPSSREHPFPPADVMAALRGLDGLRKRVGGVSSQVLTLEAPGSDRFWDRLRDERELLEGLLALDIGLVVNAQDIREAARALTVEAVRGRQLGPVDGLVAGFEQVLGERRRLLSI